MDSLDNQADAERKLENSPTPSCETLASEQSRDLPFNFKDSHDEQSASHRNLDSPTPSCESSASEHSQDLPFNFQKDSHDEQSYKQEQLNTENNLKDLLYIFQVLEDKIITFVKTELKRLRKTVNNDGPPHCGDSVEELNNAREGALKITLHFLRDMAENNLADLVEKYNLIAACHRDHKLNMRTRFQGVFEGRAEQGSPTLLNKIYTELYITEGKSGQVNFEHETRQIETAHKRPDIPIKSNDMFNQMAEDQTKIRTVLTMGVAGIGKTVSVQKFILDWADGNANQDVQLIFPLPFRELNLMKDKCFSLTDILHRFFSETKELSFLSNENCKMLFIFDGLDECRLPLNFQSNESLFDVTESSSMDTLLTNLIKGNLLPSALIWITSRPGAANSIPPEYIDRLTEIRGFNDSQKQEYFRRKITNEDHASTIITHIKSSRSLFIMCHIPVFCWILATVFENMLFEPDTCKLPKTLTQIYIYFLIFQTQQKNQKYYGNQYVDPRVNKKCILLLGKLAFQQLEKGNIIFYEQDVRECGIDITDASVYSGVFTQIFREEFGMYLGRVYCFVHLSIQEFLAALYVFLKFVNNNVNLYSKENSFITRMQFRDITLLHKSAIDRALASENGHLDLFVRFLLGLSLESNQFLLQNLFTRRDKRMCTANTVTYIKNMIKMNPSPEKSINLFHCLSELNDHSLVQEVQHFLSSGSLSKNELYPAHWSALVFLLRTSEDHMDEFDLKKYIRSEECLLRLLPAVKCAKKAQLSECNLTHKICTSLAAALHSSTTCWSELDLSDNNVQDTGLGLLSAGLGNPFCKLEILRLRKCNLTHVTCETLAKVLEMNCHLKELDLGQNMLLDSGVRLLCSGLENQKCKLEKLGLSNCGVKEEGYAALAESSKCSHLRELDLRGNDPGETGVKLLFALLEDPFCKMEKLRLLSSPATEVCDSLQSALGVSPLLVQILDLSFCTFKAFGVNKLSALLEDPHCRIRTLKLNECSITEEDCAALAQCLVMNPSQLRELDLSENEPGEGGMKQLFPRLMNPQFRLEKLRLKHCSLTEEGVSVVASALNQNPSYIKELDLSGNKFGDGGMEHLCTVLRNPLCRLEKLTLSNCRISDEGCVSLLMRGVLSLNPSHLRELNLGGNKLGDLGVKHLSSWFKDPPCQLEKLGLQNCDVSDEGAVSLASALGSNPTHLRDLDLSDNRLGDKGTESLSSLVKEPNCKLERIKLHDCGLTEKGFVLLTSALKSNPSYLQELDLSFSKPGHTGIKSLSALMEDPVFKLNTLKLTYCSITEEDCIVLTSALLSHPEHLREMDLSGNKPGDLGVKHVAALLQNPNCKLERMRLRYCSITEEGCSFVASALSSNPSQLIELDLTYNHTGDSGANLLSDAIRDLNCKLEVLKLNSCSITDKGYGYLAEALRLNPSHIRELDLSLNKPGDSGIKLLSAVLKDPQCKLESLKLFNCGITEAGCAYLASALRSNPYHLRELDLRQNRPGDSGVELLSSVQSDSKVKLRKLRIKSFTEETLQ